MIVSVQNSLQHLEGLVALWNGASSAPFLMDTQVMRQWLEAPGASVLLEGDPWRGALWARQGPLGATLDALLVLPRERRRGVATRLLNAFRDSLEPRVGWRFGGGSHHFVPGLPDGMSQAHGFFSRLGLVPDWEAHDLLWTPPCGAAQRAWDRATYRLVQPPESAALAELLRHFGKRWQEDTESRCRLLRQGLPEEIMGAFHEQRLVGFCHIWSPRSRQLGPSTFWLARQDGLWAGIGPLGVHPEQRGLGLGAGVVEAAMAYLRCAGAQRIGVDWTGLPKFYERCGFRPWLSYRGYHPG
jgi:GNAT superfamily N-acetyltransferase